MAKIRRPLIIVVLLIPAVSHATSGWGEFTVDAAGGYELHGDARCLHSVARTGMMSRYYVWHYLRAETTFVAFFDGPNHLLLCSVPFEKLGRYEADWNSLLPSPETRVWALDKDKEQLVGPFDEVAISEFCDEHGIEFLTWVTAEELSERASRFDWITKTFLFSRFLLAWPPFWVIAVLLLIAAKLAYRLCDVQVASTVIHTRPPNRSR